MNTTTSSATSFTGSRGLRYPAPDVARGFMLLLIGVLIALVGGRSVKREEEQLKSAGGKRAAKAKEQATAAEPAKAKAQKPAKAQDASNGTSEGSAKASAAPAKEKA